MRPRSPKGYSELIFKDAQASVRRTGQAFQYQLVVQRAYEEGEAELLAEDEDEVAGSQSLGAERDEKTFLLDEQLWFRSEIRTGGEKVLAWRDLSGDEGDVYEFVCDSSVTADQVATFGVAAIQCQYERKYRRSHDKATERELEEFNFSNKSIPSASPVPSPTSKRAPESILSKPRASESSESSRELTKSSKGKKAEREATPTMAPPATTHPEAREIYDRKRVELHLFDFESSTFMLQDKEVIATVSEVGVWQYWLQISSDTKDWLGQPIVADLNPVFNFEYLSFIFNHFTDDGFAYSWLLRFQSQVALEEFQEGVMKALWEQLNETKWMKNKDEEREYVLNAFQDLTMEDQPAEEEEEEEAAAEDVEDDGERSEHYDSDESADDVETKQKDGDFNSQLAVGYKHDRSFVVRGSKIGVFKHMPNNHLEFSTNISKVQTPNGKLFSPKKVMLHAEDTNMVLQNADNPNSLYRMDLEYGKVVDEWKVHDDIPVHTFAPDKASP